MRVTWNTGPFTRAVKNNVDDILKKGAEDIKRDAQALVPVRTGTLAIEIEVRKSKFKDGGYIIQAQGPGNYSRYYASFVELGTHKMVAQPYLRPALKANKGLIVRKLKQALK